MGNVHRHLLLFFCTLFAALSIALPVQAESGDEEWTRPEPDYSKPATYVHEWNRLFIQIIRIDGFTPGSAARNYSYANIAAYHAALPAFPDCQGLEGQLTGFTAVPEPSGEIDPRVAIVSAYETIAPQLIYRTFMSENAAAADYERLATEGIDPRIMDRSKEYGKIVAEHVIEWMKDDRFVQIGAKSRYEVPEYPGAWVRTPPAYHDPVDPYWNEHRPFVMKTVSQFEPGAPPEFSTDPDSDFYKMNMDVYEISKKLTKEQALIATFWDCNPIHSHFDGHMMFNTRQVSPGGHWINIASIAAEKEGIDLMESLEMYVEVSTALADGFISSWDAKYKFNLIRPVSYIKEHIDSTWESFIETPPFPEWTSAHSTISAAAAAVLTDHFGDSFEFDDWTEAYLGLPIRSFESFREAALEVTWSRVWGGIHYRAACLEGTEAGWELGEYVAESLVTRK